MTTRCFNLVNSGSDGNITLNSTKQNRIAGYIRRCLPARYSRFLIWNVGGSISFFREFLLKTYFIIIGPFEGKIERIDLKIYIANLLDHSVDGDSPVESFKCIINPTSGSE